MFENHLKKLEERHWKINKDIDLMERSGKFDDAELATLKKERLSIKDEIERVKKEHKLT